MIMNKMILYKEWLKTRWILLGIAVVMVGILRRPKSKEE